jgi:hypothetical protein
MDEICGTCSRRGAIRKEHNILIGKPEEKASLCRPRCRWQSNVLKKYGLRVRTEIGWLRAAAH